MYVYVKNWNIVYKSQTRVNWIKDSMEIICWYNMNDNLIFEDGEVRIYEKSKQYEKDVNKYKRQKQVDLLQKKNEELTQIANKKITKEMELDKKGLEANEHQRLLYLLRNMRNEQAKKSME